MTNKKHILVTGGLGFIGSHCALELLQQGHKVVIIDNLVNSNAGVAAKIKAICSPEQRSNLTVVIGDLCDKTVVNDIFTNYPVEAVIHFAALKAVGESCEKPLRYWQNNLNSTFTLLEVMAEHQCEQLIFSSSATVYGENPIPYQEDAIISRASSPYGNTKIAIEQLIRDISLTGKLRAINLRYFNPVGAHPSGLLGEEYKKPLNIIPMLQDTYLGKRQEIAIFGDDYATADGTCERDYIHIMDLVHGHLLALNYLQAHPEVQLDTFNLGSGKPISVKEIINTFSKFSDREIKVVVAPRRAGDLAAFWADTTKAEQVLGFKVQYTLEQMCEDSLRFTKNLAQE